MERAIGIAVVGTGYWGPGLARNLEALPEAELRHLVDLNEQRAQAVRDRLGSAAATHADFDRALSDPGVDGVVIATPVHTHFPLARQALLAGKHVFVEKPLATTLEHCRELEALSAERNLKVMVGHIFRFNAAATQVKDYIDSGELGDLLYLYSRRVNLGRVQADVNALWSFAPHDFSILQHWLGFEPISVQARGFSYLQEGVEDVVFVTISYPNGINAHLHLGWLDPRKVREMTVVGSKKMVVFNDVAPQSKIQLYDSRVSRAPVGPTSYSEWQVDIRHGDVVVPSLDWVEPLRAELAHFVASIRNDTPCINPASDGTAVTTAILGAQLSLHRRGEEVFLDEVREAGTAILAAVSRS